MSEATTTRTDALCRSLAGFTVTRALKETIEHAKTLEAENAGLRERLVYARRLLKREDADLDWIDEALRGKGGASLADAICKACIPGGQSCDPQQVADSIRGVSREGRGK